jgi:hypothetical protein
LLGGFSSDDYSKKAIIVLYKEAFIKEDDFESVLKNIKNANCVHNVSLLSII